MWKAQPMYVYCCPDCLGGLIDSLESMQCLSCRKDYPVVDGVHLFSTGWECCYGGVPIDVMRRILARAPLVGWREALMEHEQKTESSYSNDIRVSPLRSGFKFLLDRFETGSVLECRCGMGTVTTSLARNFATVYATDPSMEYLQFTRIRTRQENLRNVTLFCSGGARHIPLPDKSLDVIVANGVLERIPEYCFGEPRSAQLEFLKELRRVLKKDGILFVGVENRFGYGYLMGQKEDQTGLRFAAPIPRKISNIYSRTIRGKPYRTYTHSRSGYQSLLKSTGFPVVDFWGLVPDYREIEKVIRLSDETMVRGSLSNRTVAKRIRNLALKPMLSSVVGSFGILAGTKTATPYITRLLAHLSEKYLNGENVTISQYITTSTGSVQVHFSRGDEKYIAKLPLSAKYERRFEASVRNFEWLEHSQEAWPTAFLIPRPIARGKYLGQSFLVEPVVVGESLDHLVERADVRKRIFPQLCDYLALLCKSTRKPGGSWGQILAQSVRQYGSLLLDGYRRIAPPDPQLEHTIGALPDYLMFGTPPGQGFHCAIHGDFWPGNIMVNKETMRLTGILDWGRFEVGSLPFLDLLDLLSKHDEEVEDSRWAHNIVNLHKSISAGSQDTALLRDYAGRIGVPRDLISKFLIVYWIKECMKRVCQNFSPYTAKIAIREPLNHLQKFIGPIRELVRVPEPSV